MNIYVIIGIIGVISGILCARADVPLAWSGRRDDKADARSLGKIALWWTEVNESWFDKSFWLSCVGQPGTYLTMWFLAELIGQNNAGLALALKINTFIGAYTGLYFHGAVVTKYIVYRRLAGKISDDDAQTAINAIDKRGQFICRDDCDRYRGDTHRCAQCSRVYGRVQSGCRSAHTCAAAKARLEARRVARLRVCAVRDSSYYRRSEPSDDLRRIKCDQCL